MMGSADSWLYEEVGEEKAKRAFTHGQAMFLCSIPTAIFGSWLGSNFGLEYPWFFSELGFIFASLLTFILMKESRQPKDLKTKAPSYWQIVREGIRISFRNKTLLRLFLMAGLSMAAFQVINLYWPLVFEPLFGTAGLGFVWAAIALSTGLGGYLGQIEKREVSLKLIRFWYVLIGMAIIIGIAAGSLPLLFIAFIVHELGRGVLPPLIFEVCNRETPSEIRSTVASARAMSKTFGAVLSLLAFALVSVYFSPIVIWFLAGIILAVGTLLIFLERQTLKV